MRCRGIAVILAGISCDRRLRRCRRGGSNADSSITVIGNRHIGADMIRSYFHAAPRRTARCGQRSMRRSNASTPPACSRTSRSSRDGDRVLVMVVENPTIGRIAVRGQQEDQGRRSQERRAVEGGRPAVARFVQSDVVRMHRCFTASTAISTCRSMPKTIEPKSGSKNARVNLVFEIKEGEKLAVRQVVFAGNSAFSETKLKGVIKTGVTNVLSFLLNNDTYDADKIENDRDLLRRFYLRSRLCRCARVVRRQLRGRQEGRRGDVQARRRPAIPLRQGRYRIQA